MYKYEIVLRYVLKCMFAMGIHTGSSSEAIPELHK